MGRRRSRRANQLDVRKEILQSGQWQRCPRCQSQTSFCGTCAAKFNEMVSEDLCKTLAFGPEVQQELEQMFEDLKSRVDQISLAQQSLDAQESVQSSKHRRRTIARARQGLQIDNIALKIEQDNREKSGLLVKQSAIDVMPTDAVQWLAGIDGTTRHWLHAHNQRIVAHDRWLRTNAADREISRQDSRIDNKDDFAGIAGIDSLYISKSQIGRPRATLTLAPSLADVKQRILARASGNVLTRP